MKTNTMLLIGGLAIAGYMLYRQSQKDKLADVAAQQAAAAAQRMAGAMGGAFMPGAQKSETEVVLAGAGNIIETTGEQLAKFFG